MRQKKKKLTTSMLLLSIIPLLGFGLLILLITSNIIYNALKDEVSYSLEVLTDATYQAYQALYPGDYEEKNGILEKGGIDISQRHSFVDERKRLTEVDYTLFYGDTRYLTTILNEDGSRAVGTAAEKEVVRTVIEQNEPYFSDTVLVNGKQYFGYYMPVENSDGTVVGMVFAGKPRDEIIKKINHNIFIVCLLEIATMLVMIAAIRPYSKRLVYALHKTEKFLGEVAQGDLTAKIDPYVLKRKDEIGEMGRFAVMLQESIVDLVGKDPLTGLGNRRNCDIVLQNLTASKGKSARIFTVVMADIDHFKCVNDTYGHQAGDETLKIAARLMKEHMEHLGFVFRWGGEEFLLIYEDMGEEESRRHLKRLQEEIRAVAVPWKNENIHITMTFGMADYAKEKTPEKLVSLADKNLYQGKNQGRDRIVGTEEGMLESEDNEK